ncbi:MAG: transcription factor S [Nitrososphaerales archaeon]
MQFCPKCSARLKMKKEEDEEKAVKMTCPKCDYSTDQVEVAKTASKSKKKSDTEEDPSIKVLNEEDDVKALPTTNVECPKCGNGEAVWWMLQTRSADEPTTQFYRCTKCNHTWRNYA